MKVTINGSGVTPQKIYEALLNLEDEYGVKIKDLTLYLRFLNEKGRFVDPKLPANASELVITIDRPDEEAPLSQQELLDMVEQKLESKIHGEGVRIVVSMADDLQITKGEAEQILNSFEDRPTVRAIERKAIQVARKRGKNV